MNFLFSLAYNDSMLYGERKRGVIVERAGKLLELGAVHERGILGAKVGIALFDTG